jgi:hypothetical protein
VKRLGRATQGVIVVRLRSGEYVSTLAPVVEQTNDNGLNGAGTDGAAAAETPAE